MVLVVVVAAAGVDVLADVLELDAFDAVELVEDDELDVCAGDAAVRLVALLSE